MSLMPRKLLIFCLILSSVPCLIAQTPQPVRSPIGDTLTRALATSSLTTPGSQPFHLKLLVHDAMSPSSGYHAEIEEYWVSPNLWKRIVNAPTVRQVTTVNDSGTHIESTGDYFPLWLRGFVIAISDPVPSAIWGQPNIQIKQESLPGGRKSLPCANVQVGISDKSWVPADLCFFSDGRIADVQTPGYEMEFNEYYGFAGKQIPRLFISSILQETLLVGKIEQLEGSNKGPGFFDTPSQTDDSDPLSSVRVAASQIQRLAGGQIPIEWPVVRSGKTEGTVSVYVSVDTHGQVREASIIHSDNPEVNRAVVDQLQHMKWKPAVSKGSPVQIEGPLVFPFSTKMDPSLSYLSGRGIDPS
jgi:TonB family protein